MICIVHIPKTAGSSLNDIFIRRFGRRFLVVEPWVDLTRAFSPADLRLLRQKFPHVQHVSSHRAHPYVPLEEVDPNVKFLTAVRDPISFYRSAYFHTKYRTGRFSSLPEFLSYRPFHNRQTRYICGEENVELAKSILRERVAFVLVTEMLAESVALLRTLLPNECGSLPDPIRTNLSSASNEDAGREETEWHAHRSEIEYVNRLDAELYRFVKDELFPEYKQLAARAQTSCAGPPEVRAFSAATARAAYSWQRAKYKSELRSYRSSGWKQNKVDISLLSKKLNMFPDVY